MDRLNRRFGRTVTGFTEPALDRLVDYDWPGNIRELRNLVEAVFISLPDGAPALLEVPDDLGSPIRDVPVPAAEREQILSVLSATNWNKSKAAEKLNWSRMTLYRKLAKYRLVKSADAGTPDDCHTSASTETEVDTMV